MLAAFLTRSRWSRSLSAVSTASVSVSPLAAASFLARRPTSSLSMFVAGFRH
jgi:hypothetical protein